MKNMTIDRARELANNYQLEAEAFRQAANNDAAKAAAGRLKLASMEMAAICDEWERATSDAEKADCEKRVVDARNKAVSAKGYYTRAMASANTDESAPAANATSSAADSEENTSSESKPNKWAWFWAILALLLAIHLFWCLANHNEGQEVASCHICNKVEEQCTCASEMQAMQAKIVALEEQTATTTCTVCKKLEAECTCASEMQAMQAKIVALEEQTATTTCTVCKKLEAECTCAAKVADLEAQLQGWQEHVCEITVILEQDVCSGLCLVHCVEEPATIPAPTTKPSSSTPKPVTPTPAPTAEPQPTETPYFPVWTPTQAPTQAPTATPAPTQCPHTHVNTEYGTWEKQADGSCRRKQEKTCAKCGEHLGADWEICNHPNTSFVMGEAETRDDGIYTPRHTVCDYCNHTVATAWAVEVFEDWTIQSDLNDFTYDDTGEAAKPIG